MNIPFAQFRKNVDAIEPITSEQQKLIEPTSPIKNCEEIVRIIRKVDNRFAHIWCFLYKAVFERCNIKKKQATLINHVKRVIELWKEKEKMAEQRTKLAAARIAQIDNEVSVINKAISKESNIDFVDMSTTTTLINKAIDIVNNKGMQKYKEMVLEALGLEEEDKEIKEKSTKKGKRMSIDAPIKIERAQSKAITVFNSPVHKLTKNNTMLALPNIKATIKHIHKISPAEVSPFSFEVFHETFSPGNLFHDDILHPLSEYSTPRNYMPQEPKNVPSNLLIKHPQRSLQNTKYIEIKNKLTRFHRKHKSTITSSPVSITKRRNTAPSFNTTTITKHNSLIEEKANEIVNNCIQVNENAKKDLSRAVTVKKVVRKELRKIQRRISADHKPTATTQLKREVQKFMKKKCLFIYGKGEMGRYLDNQALDMIRVRDQISKMDLKYTFMKDKLFKLANM